MEGLQRQVTFFRRTVVELTEEGATQVKLDVPLRYPAKLRDEASLRVATGWLSEVGIKRLAITQRDLLE